LCVLFIIPLFDLVLQDLTSFKVWFLWLVLQLRVFVQHRPDWASSSASQIRLQFLLTSRTSPPGDFLDFVPWHPVPAASFFVIYLCRLSRSRSPSQELRFPRPSFITASIFLGTRARDSVRSISSSAVSVPACQVFVCRWNCALRLVFPLAPALHLILVSCAYAGFAPGRVPWLPARVRARGCPLHFSVRSAMLVSCSQDPVFLAEIFAAHRLPVRAQALQLSLVFAGWAGALPWSPVEFLRSSVLSAIGFDCSPLQLRIVWGLLVETGIIFEPYQMFWVFLIFIVLLLWFFGHVYNLFGKMCERQWIALYVCFLLPKPRTWLCLHRLVFLLCFHFPNTDSEGQ
jgi:hypothetical protein